MDVWWTCPFEGPIHCFGAELCALLLVLSPPTAAAPQSPFVAADGGVFDGPGNPIIPEVLTSSAIGPVIVETGSLTTAYGKFRSAFGSNGFDIQVTGGLDREVDGGSIWSDGFLVTGGTGSGTLNLSAHIVGSVTAQAEMGYALFMSPDPFDLQTIVDAAGSSAGFWQVQLPNSVRVLFSGIASRCGMSHASKDCGHVPLRELPGASGLTSDDKRSVYFRTDLRRRQPL